MKTIVKLTKEHEGSVIRAQWKFDFSDSKTMTGYFKMVICESGANGRILVHGPRKHNWLWMGYFDLNTLEILPPEEAIIWKLDHNM